MKIVWKYFAGSLLALLGFGSCRQIGLFRAEYGQPHANFKLIGDVKDAAGKPVEGIRVVANPTENEEEAWYNDTTYTDARGHFEVEQPTVDTGNTVTAAECTSAMLMASSSSATWTGCKHVCWRRRGLSGASGGTSGE